MNDLIKNIDIEYLNRGWDKLYPTDASFIKLWQSADHFEDVAETLNRHLTKRIRKTISECLAVHERWLVELKSAGSKEAFCELQGLNKESSYLYDVMGADRHQRRDLNHARVGNYNNIYSFGEGSSEVAEELTKNVNKLRETLSEDFKCYDSGWGSRKNAYLRGKAKSLQSNYELTLKDLPARPQEPLPSTRSTLQALAQDYLQKYNNLEVA